MGPKVALCFFFGYTYPVIVLFPAFFIKTARSVNFVLNEGGTVQAREAGHSELT